jgi:hypothetical protein
MSAPRQDSKVSRIQFVREEPSVEITDPVRFVRERLWFDPDEEQARALRGRHRGIVLCTRQWGKSTVMAAKRCIGRVAFRAA